MRHEFRRRGIAGGAAPAFPRYPVSAAIAGRRKTPPTAAGGRRVTEQTVTLWRPVGPAELRLIEAAGMKTFPARLPEQPIFYPVLSEDYAVKIARDWNVPASGAGFVTRFRVRRDYLSRYDVQVAGGQAHREYWIPAEDLPAFNAAIVGEIEVVREFR
jgi:hypothetical protein